MKNKELAKAVITSYLGTSLTPLGMNDIYEIRGGNDELLLEHIKALRNIFEAAIKEIEDGQEIP